MVELVLSSPLHYALSIINHNIMACTKQTARKNTGSKVARIQLATMAAVRNRPPLPVGGVKKPRRYHPRTITLRKIHCYQKTRNLLIHKLPFQRLMIEIIQDIKNWRVNLGDQYRIIISALLANQESIEAYLVGLDKDTNLCTIH